MRVSHWFLWGLLTTAGIGNDAMAAPDAKADADAKPNAIWFEDVMFSVPPTDEQLSAVTVYVRNQILKTKNNKNNAWPLAVRIDTQPRLVFISVSDAVKPARVVIGRGKGLIAATNDALKRLQLNSETNKTFEPRWIKVDLVANVFDQSDTDLSKNMLYPRSLFGIAFSRQRGAAVLAEEIVANELADHFQVFSLERFSKYVQQREPKQAVNLNGLDLKKADLLRFSTRSMFADRHETAKLYRGHRMYDKLTKDLLMDAAKQAKEYLLRSITPNGQFAFIYHADLDEHEARYSIGHHYSYTYALLDTYEQIKDERLIDAAQRALAYGKRAIGTWTKRGRRVHCVIDDKRNVYLRFNAFATMSYAKLIQHLKDKATDDDRQMLDRFALSITTAQQGNGYITLHQTYPDGRVHDEITSVVFLPGEALTALDEVNKADPKKQWQDAIKKTADYVIHVRDKDRDVTRMIQDPWTLIGMERMYRQSKQRAYLDHALKIAKALRSRNNVKVRYEDWFGGYFKPPGTLPTAVRNVSLAAAYELARDTKHTTEAKANLEAVIRGNAFLLQTQFRPESAMYFKNPQRVLGAAREGLTVPTIRTDYVQYSLKSFLSLHRIMEADGVEAYTVKRPKPEKR